ncbi:MULTISPECIES: SMP-30/gluconolactonase/LRE family protein [unclassified Pseudomonas]|uniref:SMP-30/gluconolactonase/LRE family protein n=1 Tax=unclassified Pseudomonas TaxID=196821 RepID=UPI000BD62C09|nr:MULTISPECIES: SMP-30/gluconolactonase/LRE family protein [unclassified Pseudomonas]PVZ16002.1 sugar lactone lactonase YvrE [Pseudomonas sp. URIL14HWK12:I12]PVZ26142.1 sugar lactone lactonase YvrE [Pseudomonas sp. URIL14HWK12:I10]PVZ36334.1 sugar lactone lactonase YvrE [Pseudomonas sp. URIL14HWK12:I11]SNZ18396.1 Sugar lactone lactonase YvrE [Pseudomonas sp. URIL14HWK12:I9]
MKISAPRCLAAVGDRCGEAAVWSASDNAIWWVDINRFLVHRLGYPDGALHSWVFEEPVTALALTDEPGRWLVALASQLIWWWPDDDRRQPHGFKLSDAPVARLNDGRADPQGNFWVGSMFNNVAPDGGPQQAGGTPGRLFRITPKGETHVRLADIGISNTLCWSPCGTRFYFADSTRNCISVYHYDAASGDITPQGTPFFEGFERGAPDGSAIDRDGYLWNCRYGGHGIARIAPDGRLDRFIELPTANPTTCTFGGPGLSTLFITSASYDTGTGDRLAGSLWALDTGTAGMGENVARVG